MGTQQHLEAGEEKGLILQALAILGIHFRADSFQELRIKKNYAINLGVIVWQEFSIPIYEPFTDGGSTPC